MNDLEMNLLLAKNLQGRMKHITDQLIHLKDYPEQWSDFKEIINMKINHVINDSITLGSEKAAHYMALLQNQLNDEFCNETIDIIREQFDEVLKALDAYGPEILINNPTQVNFAH